MDLPGEFDAYVTDPHLGTTCFACTAWNILEIYSFLTSRYFLKLICLMPAQVPPLWDPLRCHRWHDQVQLSQTVVATQLRLVFFSHIG
jgi:hypothetical protein